MYVASAGRRSSSPLTGSLEGVWLGCGQYYKALIRCQVAANGPTGCEAQLAEIAPCVERTLWPQDWEEIKKLQKDNDEEGAKKIAHKLNMARTTLLKRIARPEVVALQYKMDQADQSCRDLILKHVACADKFGESATPCLDIELDVKHCAYQQLAPERWSEFSSCKAQNPADYHEKCKPHQLAIQRELDSLAEPAMRAAGWTNLDFIRYQGPFRLYTSLARHVVKLSDIQDHIEEVAREHKIGTTDKTRQRSWGW